MDVAEQERVSTGIDGLDEVLNGGLMAGQSYLLVGSAGTGKTLCSLQWLMDGADKGDNCLFVTLAEPLANVQRNIRGFGWDLNRIDYMDLNPTSKNYVDQSDEYTVFPPSEVERMPMWEKIYDAVEETQPDRLVIDSMTQLHYLSVDDYQFRKQLLALVTYLHQEKCTTYLTFEPAELDREVSVALTVDGLIHLQMKISPNRMTALRSLQVQKLRGSDFMSGLHTMRITDDGIRVFAHRIEKHGETEPGRELLSSGIDNLDRLIGGGLDSGTVSLISGPGGVGKSTLGMQFLTDSVKKGKKSVYYTFEESPRSILARSESVGQPAKEQIENEMLKIVRVNPMELYPDEFLQMVRDAVEKEGVESVLIDSLRGYELAMEEFGSMRANLQNLATYLNRKGITTILINEVEKITGDIMATEMKVSYLADSIILLRYAELKGRIIKVITPLKKRYGTLEPAIAQLEISKDGVSVSEELTNMRGILTGAPTSVREKQESSRNRN